MDRTEPNARDVAVRALCDRAGNVSARLARLLGAAGLPPADRSLARELALGVVRRKATLRAVLAAFLTSPRKKLPAPLEAILLVGLYQVLMLRRIPEFAAVDEAVDQAIRFGHKRQSGLVNGLLRGVTRGIVERRDGPAALAADVVPVNAKSCVCLARPIFPDPAASPGAYLAQAFSLPPALAERWLERFGGLAEAARIAAHADTRAAVILRVNRLRANVRSVVEALAAADVQAWPHANGLSVVLAGQADLGGLQVFRDGWVQIQDATASDVVVAARAGPGMKVLDFCAAPGTKTTHLAELMNDEGQIVAQDVSPDKLKRIEANCRRLGISIVTTRLADDLAGLEPRSFDLALVDAPCSNTGVLARRAEARWRFDPGKLDKLARDQRFLAVAAAQFVRSGGRLVYSTCSIEPEECSQVAKYLARPGRGMRVIREELVLPGGADEPTAWRDGGYYAIFEVQ